MAQSEVPRLSFEATWEQNKSPRVATYRHGHATYAHVGAQTLSYPRELPEEAYGHRVFPFVQQRGHHIMHVGGCAYEQKNNEEERLEVEEGSL